MKVINEKTSRMPGVTFDPDTRIMTIEGEAYPEDVTAAFAPIFTALEEILAEDAGGTTTSISRCSISTADHLARSSKSSACWMRSAPTTR